MSRRDDGYWSEHAAPRTLTSNTVTAIGLRNWKFFADAPRLAERMPRPGDASGAVVVIRSRDLDDIQSTGLRMLENYLAMLAESGNDLLLAGVQPHVAETLERTGVADRIGVDRIFVARPDVTRALDDAWEDTQDRANKDDT